MVSNFALLASVARSALPLGKRKLRAYPSFTRTVSPIWPSLATRSKRITSIGLSPSFGSVAGSRGSGEDGWRRPAPPRDPAANIEQAVGEPDQRHGEHRPDERRDRRIESRQH